MKLTRIKGIALLVAAVLLLTGAMGAIAAGGEERREEFRMDARYWWEAPPLTPYEREQVRGIMVLILDRYFGIDVSTMSPEEFEDLGRSIGPEREKEALRLFEHYAKKKGFQMPAGIFEMPVGIPVPGEFIPPAEVSYWWELVDPEYREARIAFFQEMFPEVNVRNMTPEEFERLLNPPPPPLRLLSIEEMKGEPAVIAVHGRARSYSTQAEIREWLNRLREVQELFGILKGLTGPSFPRITASVDPAGYVEVSLTMFEGEEMTINDALAYVPEIYALIAEKAETLDIKDVPVVFRLIRIMTGLSTATSPTIEVAIAPQTTLLGYGARYRPIIGGIQKQTRIAWRLSTIGFAVRRPIPWWPDDLDYVITGHLGPSNTRTPVNTQIYQPTVASGNEVGRVAAVASMNGFADVARVAIDNWHVAPYIHIGGGHTVAVRAWGDPVEHQWVSKSGIATGVTIGRVIRTGVPENNLAFGTLQNQVRVAFRMTPGDSGAPVYRHRNGWAEGVEILGILWGWAEDGAGNFLYSIFSPTSGVRAELPGWQPHTK